MAFLPNEEDDFFPVILGQRDIAVKTTTTRFEDYGLLSTIRQKRISLQSIADEKSVLKCLKNLIALTCNRSANQISSRSFYRPWQNMIARDNFYQRKYYPKHNRRNKRLSKSNYRRLRIVYRWPSATSTYTYI